MYTILDAINELLMTTGESPVNSLGDEGSTDTSVAQFVLEQATLDAQLRGLSGGSYITTLIKNDDDEFVLPEGTVEFNCEQQVPATNASYALLVLRDGKVFNATDGTFKFSSESLTELEILVRRAQRWEELPLAMQKSITATASVEYAIRVGADEKTINRAYQREQKMLAIGNSQDFKSRQGNMLGTGGTPTRASSRNWYRPNGRFPRI